MSPEPPLLRTERLVLIAARREHLEAELHDPDRLGPLLGARVPAGWPPGEYDRDAMAFFLDRYEAEGPAAVGWYGSYALAIPADPAAPPELVAAAGYFGPPTPDGTLEIGYSVVAEARRRGYAAELARALAEHGLRQGGVRRVIAHTAAENHASRGVLERAGFRAAGSDGRGLIYEYRPGGA